jgi:hypothetical protein
LAITWVDIPFDIQSAYTVLGYNQNSWDNGIEVDADTVDWAELTPEQQEAALFIGYTEFIWCGLEDAGLNMEASPTYVPTILPTQTRPHRSYEQLQFINRINKKYRIAQFLPKPLVSTKNNN